MLRGELKAAVQAWQTQATLRCLVNRVTGKVGSGSQVTDFRANRIRRNDTAALSVSVPEHRILDSY